MPPEARVVSLCPPARQQPAQRLLEWASRRDVAVFYDAVGREHQGVHLISTAD